MPRKRLTDAQISMVVREIENGARVQEVSRKLGVTENTLYNWQRAADEEDLTFTSALGSRKANNCV